MLFPAVAALLLGSAFALNRNAGALATHTPRTTLLVGANGPEGVIHVASDSDEESLRSTLSDELDERNVSTRTSMLLNERGTGPIGAVVGGVTRVAYKGTVKGIAYTMGYGHRGPVVPKENKSHNILLYIGVAVAFVVTLAAVWYIARSFGTSDSKDEVARLFTPVFHAWFEILVAVNITLLIFGHFTNYLHLDFKFTIPGQPSDAKPVQDLNFIRTVLRSWEAGAYCMFGIVGLGVIVWPYAKLLAMMYAVRQVKQGAWSKEKGHAVSKWLNAFSKWAFAEVFVFCYSSAVLNIYAPPVDVVMNLGGYDVKVSEIELQIFLRLVLGAIILVYAIVLTVILTHWAEVELEPSTALFQKPATDAGALTTGVSATSSKAALWLTLASVVLLLVGACQPMLRVQRGGTLGKLMKDLATLDLSIVTIVLEMLTDPVLSAQPLIRMMALAVLVLTATIPFIELVFLAASIAASRAKPCDQYCFMKLGRWCRARANILSAFDCVDVMLLVGAVVMIDLTRFAEASTADECDEMKGTISDKDFMEAHGLGFAYDHGSCIKLISQFQSGWFILLVSSIMRIAAWRLSRDETSSSGSFN